MRLCASRTHFRAVPLICFVPSRLFGTFSSQEPLPRLRKSELPGSHQHRSTASPTSTSSPPGRGSRSFTSSVAHLEKEKRPRMGERKVDHSVPKASASIILVSPRNEVLLLHRVSTSSAFPSAHVFPGGNLSSLQDGSASERRRIEDEDATEHVDSLEYRLAAIRETFEESGILLAHHRKDHQKMVQISARMKQKAREFVHDNTLIFRGFLHGLDAVPATEQLHPFTRWITPSGAPRRFSAQMYLYFLPLEPSASAAAKQTGSGKELVPSSSSLSSSATDVEDEVREEEEEEEGNALGNENGAAAHKPTDDGGKEITAAEFAPAQTWVDRARNNEIILFPPQLYLLSLLAEHLRPEETTKDTAAAAEVNGDKERQQQLQAQRDSLMAFLNKTPEDGVAWADKVIMPVFEGPVDKTGKDDRVVLGLRKPKGDPDRVVLVKFTKASPIRGESITRKELNKRRLDLTKGKL